MNNEEKQARVMEMVKEIQSWDDGSNQAAQTDPETQEKVRAFLDSIMPAGFTPGPDAVIVMGGELPA